MNSFFLSSQERGKIKDKLKKQNFVICFLNPIPEIPQACVETPYIASLQLLILDP